MNGSTSVTNDASFKIRMKYLHLIAPGVLILGKCGNNAYLLGAIFVMGNNKFFLWDLPYMQ